MISVISSEVFQVESNDLFSDFFSLLFYLVRS